MKKYILKSLAVLIFTCLAALTSCNQDAEGVKFDGDGLYSFASTQMNKEVTSDDNGIVKVPIYRGNKGAESSVSLSIDSKTVEAGLFTLSSSSITFAAGESVAYAELKFGSIEKLGATTKYTVVISLTDQTQLSPAGIGEINVIINRKLTWRSLGTGTYTSGLFEESWPQIVEKAEEGNVYRLPNCITEGYPLIFSLSSDGQTLAGWDIQPIGYKHSTYGMVYFSPTNMTRTGKTLVFAMRGIVVYNGNYAVLWKGFDEILELPN